MRASARGTTSAHAEDMTTMQSGTTQLPVYPLSALCLVLGDWLATALNILTAMDAYWAISIAAVGEDLKALLVDLKQGYAAVRRRLD